MKKIIQILLLSLLLFGGVQSLQATHIVGGEIEVGRNGNNLTFTLNLYFDEINGNDGARDQRITVGIYRKSDNTRVRNEVIDLTDSTDVGYTNPDPECDNSVVQTESRVYIKTIDGSGLNDPGGYYVIFDRCCRNNNIKNIVDPQGTGMMFYTEFPSINTINSSPTLNQPVRDFACRGTPFYSDFSAVDPDGDDLVYSLTTPLRGLSNRDEPAPDNSAVLNNPTSLTATFGIGYNLSNVIDGAPTLSIDQNGILRVTPTEEGLYVFGVKVEEFRNGVKIGEVRRDYQVQVQSNCDPNDPPVISVGGSTGGGGGNGAGSLSVIDIKFELGSVTENDTCITIEVNDPQLSSTFDKQNVTIKDIIFRSSNTNNQIRFVPDVSSITDATNNSFDICIPSCIDAIDEEIIFDIIAVDGACPLPAQDTARFIINVTVPPNKEPEFDPILDPTSGGVLTLPPVGADYSVECVKAEITVGDTLRFKIEGHDPDGDSMYVFLPPASGLDLDVEGFKTEIVRSDSTIDFLFEWIPTCANLGGEDVSSRIFNLAVAVGDVYACGFKTDPVPTACVEIILNAPPKDNIPPQFLALEDSVLGNSSFNIKPGSNPLVYFDTLRLSKDNFDDVYSFRVNAFDINGDNSGDAFRLEALGLVDGMTFGTVTANAVLGDSSEVESFFNWNPDCPNISGLSKDDTSQLFIIDFVATDARDCFQVGETKIQVELLLIFEPDNNEEPLLAFENKSSFTTFDLLNEVYCEEEIIIGTSVNFNLNGSDPDVNENVVIRAEPVGFTFEEVGMFFNDTSAILNPGETLVAPFTWNPDCNSLNPNQADRTFEINFIIEDENTCELKEADTVKVKMTVKDVDAGSLAPFANAFSPNGDGVGDSYFIDNLPTDNCADSFVNISIVNRWGKEIFRSEKRDFKWEAEELPTGVYYYHVKYLNSDFKGTVHIVRGKVSK
ncbi:MAG: gliding motility-associated-like protein [Flammeovirgaceae bacterium]|jgi:gliding motility-associated-like protein